MTHSIEILGTILFALAILHTFAANFIREFSHRYRTGSVAYNFFHTLGEIEIIFGLWAALFFIFFAALHSTAAAIQFVESLNFTEPVFVFVIMAVAATKSIRTLTVQGIELVAKAITKFIPGIKPALAFYLTALILGPLLGSLITEPAAMTVIALILRDRFFNQNVSDRFKYKTLALLFVNVSIGGVLTHFAAPPVVMVAQTWGWNTPFMFLHFGVKAIIAVSINTVLVGLIIRKEFDKLSWNKQNNAQDRVPFYVTAIHILFLAAIVYTSHHMIIFLGLFLFFLGVAQITEPHQEYIQIRESLLVAFFLGGLVVLGKTQAWWLKPLLTSLTETPLFLGATFLTGITDNAALTYLGAQVQGLSEPLKHALVQGAVTGGGLTVIANAPNPAGYGILKDSFGEKGIHAGRLFIAALVPTLIAAILFRL